VGEEMRKVGWQTAIEPSYLLPSGERFQLDIVAVSGDQVKAAVVDVTVRFEQGTALRNAYTEKANKYNRLAETVRCTHNVESVKVYPIVVGSRGAVPRSTLRTLREMGLNQDRFAKYLSTIALGASIKVVSAFMDA
jgi:hypothetical protein